MKNYSNIITLNRNSRGVYCLDTTIGCKSGMSETYGGCYGDCYSANAAKRYGYDFSKTVLRDFKDEKHRRYILSKINSAKLDFIRIGCSGDPSENWQHTITIINKIKNCNKEIVIITRHWDILNDIQLSELSKLNICINTSVSAIDRNELLKKSIDQYNRIKKYCKSVLRVITFDFNTNNLKGLFYKNIQNELLNNSNVIDTVFRPSKTNELVLQNIINTSKGVFNGANVLLSKHNRKTYTGNCNNCLEMCGCNMSDGNIYTKIGISKQLNLFKKSA